MSSRNAMNTQDPQNPQSDCSCTGGCDTAACACNAEATQGCRCAPVCGCPAPCQCDGCACCGRGAG